MLGTIVNTAVIILGAIIGVSLKSGLSDGTKDTIMHGIGLSVVIIGLSMALETENIIITILSLVVGGILGELLQIEGRLERAGRWLEQRLGSNSSGDFTKAFVTASLVYCIGAMAVMGALESGLTGKHDILFAKSTLDGISSIIFGSTLGIGVAFSGFSVLIYQGLITIAASSIKVFLTEPIINEMTAVGGVLILGIGLNILGITKIKVGNMLPAIFGAIFFMMLVAKLPF
ncbi:MAG TPA: DUF554 domain-containing protein [Thermoanaerobacterales bacterium]|nr:DUF554 domain-containing protein [Thermoanaerobacterales bacterium]